MLLEIGSICWKKKVRRRKVVQAEERGRRYWETFAETSLRNNDGNSKKSKKVRGRGSDTMSFLMQQSETNAQLKKDELKIKVSALELQREQMENQSLLITQQQSIYSAMMKQLQKQTLMQHQN